jgi:hypothetical protein
LQKEVIQQEINEQMEMGAARLLEEDHWMMEVNHEPETSSGEQEECWLLAIKPRGNQLFARQKNQMS